MSENISLSSQKFDQTSVDISAFDGADVILRAWQRGLTPDPSLTVSDWADRHRWLSSRASAEPGKYRTSRTPYMREIMDALSVSNPVRRVIFMKGAQVGATEAGSNWVGYVIHNAPGPMLAVQPTVELAKRYSKQRIDQLISDTPELQQLVKPARSRDSGNTVLSKEFPGGILIITGANSAVGLRSMPARYLFLDEVDAYPPSADEEGDPVALAEARARTFSSRAKSFLTSTPTIHGSSRIERLYESTDQRRYFVPCPHCDHYQWLKFERLRWDKGRPDTAHYLCENCDKPIYEHHKTEMLERGEWRPTAESSDPGIIGFHLSSLYSPVGWYSWSEIAQAWIQAQGSADAIRTFRNTVLGETWVESGEAPEWQRLYDRRERWRAGAVPSGGVILTAGADVQRDRIEVSVWAWGRGLESWLVDHIVIDGGPDRDESWGKLTKFLGRSWPHENGHHLTIARLAIDTGYETSAVYSWARKIGHHQVSPVKGVDKFDRSGPVTGPTLVESTEGGRKIKRGVRLWTVATSVFKSELYRYLRLNKPTDEEIAAGEKFPAGYVHLPHWADADWIRQLTAEQLVTVRDKRGFNHYEWQKIRDRNEALDCRVYARAAAWIVGVDRWSEERWEQRELELAPPLTTAPVIPAPPVPRVPDPALSAPKRQQNWLGPRRNTWF